MAKKKAVLRAVLEAKPEPVQAPAQSAEAWRPAPEKEINLPERIAESRKALNEPLQPGMAIFEAPDGMVIVAEAKHQHVWYREGNHGKGMFINPRREGNNG